MLAVVTGSCAQFISTGLLIFAAGTFFWHFASSTYDPLVPSRLSIFGPDLVLSGCNAVN